MTAVDLVIPTHNGSDLLRRCLRSLSRSTFIDVEVTIFDDGSTEPIADVVRAEAPAARVIRSDTNVGLARGLNIAIAAGTAPYVVLLNNDTEVEPQWLERLVACAGRHPNAGSVASKLRLLSDRNRLHSAGDYYSVHGMPGNRGVWLPDCGQFDREEEIFAACGGAALYRRAALDDVALRCHEIFDDRLFMYCEDVDLGWRLQRAGWSCVFAPDAVVYHAVSATAGGSFASYWVARNVWIVMARSVPRDVLRPYRSRVIAYHLGRVARAALHMREQSARATLRGTAAGIALALATRRQAPVVAAYERERLRRRLSTRSRDPFDRP